MSNLSGSMLERSHECLASTVLPQFPSSGIEAEHGNENHSKAEREELPELIRPVVENLIGAEKETSFIIDTKNRTATRVNGHRNYGRLDWWKIGTTPDLWSQTQDPALVLDYKSRKRVTSAARNWQVKSQVCAIAGLSGATRVTAGIAYLNDGFIDWADFGPIEINAAWADLYALCTDVKKMRDVMAEFPASQVTPKRGEWCGYCPCLLSCPAQRQALSLFKNTPDVAAMVAAASDSELEDARLAKKSIETMLEQFEKALRQRAEVQPIQLRNGKQLSLVESSRTSDDIYLLKEELRRHGVDPEKFKKRVTFKQLREVKG